MNIENFYTQKRVLLQSLFLVFLVFSFSLKGMSQQTFGKDYQHWSDVENQWIPGNLNKQKATYQEGEVVPHVFRLESTGGANPQTLENDQSYSFDIIYDYYQRNTNAGGFKEIAPYDESRSPIPNLTSGLAASLIQQGSFYLLNADITNVSAPVQSSSGGNVYKTVKVTFTYTGENGGSAEFYFGLRLAGANEVIGSGIPINTKGSSAWSGASLQTGIGGDNIGSMSLQIDVLPEAGCPNITIDAGSYGPVCENGSAISLAGAPGGGVWVGDGVSGNTTDGYKFDPNGLATGDYELEYFYSENGCTYSAKTTIKIIGLPVAPTVTAGPFCISDNKTIADLPQPASGTYTYYQDASTITPLGATYVIPVGNNTYYVSFTSTDGCEGARASITVTVNPASAAAINLTGNNPACSGNNSGTINISSKTGEVLRWEHSTNGTEWDTYTAAGTNSQLTFSNIITSTWFRVVVQSGVCTEASSTPIKISVNNCGITFTQGFWGGTQGNGKDCKGQTVQQILTALLGTNPAPFVGTATKGLTLNNVSKLISIMPGGGYVKNVFDGAYTLISNYPPSSHFDNKTKKLNSVVVSQTIALKLNVLYNPQLGNVVFEPNKNVLQTAKITFLNGCIVSSVATSSSSYTMSGKVLCYLFSNNTYSNDINGLLSLANDVIGGTLPIVNNAPFSFSELVQTLDAINNGFNEGRMLTGFSGTYSCGSALMSTQRVAVAPVVEAQATKVSVSAFPNPYTDKLRFVVTNPEPAQGSLEVFNMLGQKVKTVFSGMVQAGTQNFEFSVPSAQRSNLIYILRVGDKQVTGKVLQAKD